MSEKSLKKQTVKGLFWSCVERFSTQGVQFVFSFIIARQLMPADYGLVAMLGIFMAIAQSFIDSGFSNALIQKQNRTNIDYCTVFYFNIAIGLIMYLILIACAPLIADFYDQPQLKAIISWVALNFLISAGGAVQLAKLTIALDFKRQAWISLISVLLSGIVGIWLAYHGFGVWTLVYQSLLSNFLNTLLLWLSAKWIPSLVFSWNSFKELFNFGSKLLMGGLLHTIYQNLYTLVIGKFFTPTQLGFFNRAFTLTQYPSSNITNILTRVTYPVECEFQGDNQKLEDKFYLFIKLTAFIVFPLMIGLCALSEPLIRLVLTEKWMGAVPYIQIMCFAYMWDPIMRMNWDLLNTKHRSDYSLRSEIIKKIVAVTILFVSIMGGLSIMCLGLVFYSIADIFIVTIFTKRLLPNVTFRNEIAILIPILFQSLIMGIIVYSLKYIIHSDVLLLLIGLIIGIFIYILLSVITKNQEFQYIYLQLKRKLKWI